MTVPSLTARDVSRIYENRNAVANATLKLHAGRITCLLGPSGCGKSTLLRLVAGLEPVDSGEIEIGGTIVSAPGKTVAPEDRGIGLVFQDFALFPHLSVADNIGFGLKNLPASQRRERVMTLLAQFHLEALADKWPHTLSGGEQQRVAIARALARSPSVLLLDEPFSGLDGHLRATVRQSVLADLRTTGTAVLIVTHDPEEAMLIADELALMAGGRILQTGSPPECYLRPVSIEAARLLGEATILPVRISGGVANTPFGIIPAPEMPDGEANAMIRPEALRFDMAGVPVKVVDVRFGGAFQTVTLAAQDLMITARMSGTSLPEVGAQICVSLDPARTVIYPS
ncbi:ABC transporter ATP-binding protein [Parasphingorhabdus sp. JC815]|uniref:ABC transporter ATP-binding protein n=1 Tax=Parasphingorhabdus sp. JC815 TaxID=3232140 RepID=UPI00345B45E4